MRALISVSDKTGILDFARGLVELGWIIYSTGGTQQAIAGAGLPVESVSQLTGFPEILDGRVKTLHPRVHGGLLARRDRPEHQQQLAEHDINPIDLVVVNLYPFVQTISRPDVTLTEALEQIDIGGPTLLRASAKNFPHVLTVVDPADYSDILDRLRSGDIDLSTRRRLARQAFQHTATYDTAIAHYLLDPTAAFPPEATLALTKVQDLRYGENPHQPAALYADATADRRSGIVGARQISGKEISYNNILDLDAALGVVSDFAAPAIAIIKHSNPCGLACHESLDEAYRRALSGDPVSAFGGIVAANRPIDAATALAMKPTFFDAIIAPGYTPEALEVFRPRRNCVLMESAPEPDAGEAGYQLATRTRYRMVSRDGHSLAAGGSPWAGRLDFRRVSGGFLVQAPDQAREDDLALQVVTRRNPTLDEISDLLFAWRAVKHIKSNAIVLAKDLTLLGMGAGQPNRVTSVRLAIERAGDRSRPSVLASDAFFPFPDGLEAAAEAGATAVIQPGGSIRDEEVIAAADRYGVAMVFTGVRHFRH